MWQTGFLMPVSQASAATRRRVNWSGLPASLQCASDRREFFFAPRFRIKPNASLKP